MNKGDLRELETRMGELAEALGGRAPGAKAMLVWLDTLAECQMDDVRCVMSDWAKSHIKMPAPADVLKACRERVSVRIEDESRRNNAAAGFDREQLARNANSPIAKRELANMNAILGAAPEPRDWARVLRVREEAGEPIDYIQRRLWREALRVA